MKTLFTSIVLTAALAFSSVAQAGFISYELTDTLSEDIRDNGAYTLQTVNNELSIEYWLYDRLAMLRFNAEDINYVFYTPFSDVSNNDFMNVTYSDSEVFSAVYEEFGVYEFYTFQSVDYIDYVFQIDDGYTFTGLDFESKNAVDDAVFTNDYATMYYEEFKVAELNFDLADTGSVDVPEPSSLGIFALAGFALVSRMRKRSNAKA